MGVNVRNGGHDEVVCNCDVIVCHELVLAESHVEPLQRLLQLLQPLGVGLLPPQDDTSLQINENSKK